MTWISFRGTFKSFLGLTEVIEQTRNKVLTYELVNPTFKITLISQFLATSDVCRRSI